MKYAFYSHGGCENHGCEAIVRALSALIKSHEPETKIKLYTLNAKSDKSGSLPNIDEVEEFKYILPAKATAVQKLKISLLSRNSQKRADEYYYSLSCKNPSLAENDIYISVGGDNYCYGDNHMAAALNKELKRLNKKTVLWGCSIGEENLTEEKILDLKTFDLIVARESLTYEILIKHGIDKNTVLYPDPAFTLDVDSDTEKMFKIKSGALGFNFSSMAADYSGNKEKSKEIIIEFLRYVLNKSEKEIIMIPHVAWDQGILSEITQALDSERVTLIPNNLTAAQYKSIISRCDMFIGARTHATIAAYSTCVPTLVIGYSVKSKGIAKDIFGTYENLVVPVSEIDSAKKMIDVYESFLKEKERYRKHLQNFIPEYIKKSEDSVKELDNL